MSEPQFRENLVADLHVAEMQLAERDDEILQRTLEVAALIEAAAALGREIERLRDLVRLVRHQLLAERIAGLGFSPIEVQDVAQDWREETEGLINAAEAKEKP